MKTSKQIHKELIALSKKQTSNFLGMGRLLIELAAFKDGTVISAIKDIGVAPRAAYYWMEIVEAATDLKIKDSDIIHLGWTKMMLLIKADALGETRETALRIMKLAKPMTVMELKSYLNSSTKVVFYVPLTKRELSMVKRVMREKLGAEFQGRKFMNSGKCLILAMKIIDKMDKE